MFKTENLTLTGAWQSITKDFEVKAISLKSKNGNDINIRNPSTADAITLEENQTIVINDECSSQEYTFQIRGTLADVIEIIKQY